MGFKAILAVSAVSFLPFAVGAQNQSLGQPVQVDDVLTFEAGLDLERHSNIFKLDSGISPLATYGGTQRGDSLLTGLFGVKFDRDFSLQRVTVFGQITPQKYLNYSRFDNVGYKVGANWDWAIGRPWFGRLGVDFGQSLSSFNDIQQAQKNLQRRTNFYFSAGLRMTPSWAVLAKFDTNRLDNTSNAQAASDYSFVGAEIGVRYAPGTGNEFDFVYRTTTGKYPNRQALSAQGLPLLLSDPSGVDNGFKESSLLARMQYKPNEDTKLAGEIGFTRRNFDNFSTRNFSGPVAQLTFDWRPGGAFFMGADLIRAISSQELLTANYVDVLELRLRPTFRLTGKTSLVGIFSLQNRTYDGEPFEINPPPPTRKDRLLRLGVALNWKYSRKIDFTFGLRRETRSSSENNLDYDDNIFTIGGRIKL